MLHVSDTIIDAMMPPRFVLSVRIKVKTFPCCLQYNANIPKFACWISSISFKLSHKGHTRRQAYVKQDGWQADMAGSVGLISVIFALYLVT